MKTHIKYPCNYEIDVESFWYEFGFHIVKDGPCPLHGINCKAVITKTE